MSMSLGGSTLRLLRRRWPPGPLIASRDIAFRGGQGAVAKCVVFAWVPLLFSTSPCFQTIRLPFRMFSVVFSHRSLGEGVGSAHVVCCLAARWETCVLCIAQCYWIGSAKLPVNGLSHPDAGAQSQVSSGGFRPALVSCTRARRMRHMLGLNPMSGSGANPGCVLKSQIGVPDAFFLVSSALPSSCSRT